MGDKCSVLIVEDDADVRGALAAILETQGFTVAEAEHGLEALRHLRASSCTCLIVLDLFMPTMDGWKFRDEQVKDPHLAAIPVVVVSADQDAARRAGATLGVAAAMQKPVDLDRFIDVVRQFC
jgi:CheY-like chemotaxis protein